jgi:hypothetical protein
MKDRAICHKCISNRKHADPEGYASAILQSDALMVWTPQVGLRSLTLGTQTPFCKNCKYLTEHAAADAVRAGGVP